MIGRPRHIEVSRVDGPAPDKRVFYGGGQRRRRITRADIFSFEALPDSTNQRFEPIAFSHRQECSSKASRLKERILPAYIFFLVTPLHNDSSTACSTPIVRATDIQTFTIHRLSDGKVGGECCS